MSPSRVRILRHLVAFIAAVGTLVPVAAVAQETGYAFYALTPCRAYDSRGCTAPCTDGGGILTTTMTDQEGLRPLRLRGICGIPSTAKAVTVNHTVISATAPIGGVARLCPNPLGGGQTICRAWTLYGYNETTSNGGVLPLGVVAAPGTDPDIQLQGLGGIPTPPYLGVYTYHWTIDVTGYFE